MSCSSPKCRNEKKPDFCWICCQPWQGTGFAVCGNKDCASAFVNERLKIEQCGTTNKVLGRKDAKCPMLRACPRCLAVE